MKGLFIKDICLLKQQKNSMFIMLIISIILSLSGNQTAFVVSYLTLLATTLAIGTITYDDFGNGLPFLFTLPSSRMEYIKEKYVFTSVFTVIVCTIASVLTSIIVLVNHKSFDLMEHLEVCFLVLCIVFITMSVMIPIHLKYGAEKSKVVMIIMMGIIFVTILLGAKFGERFGIRKEEIFHAINQVNEKSILAIIIFIVLVIFVISFRISTKIIKQKEF